MAEVHDQVLTAVRERGLRFVRFTWTDNAGLIRAKAVNAAFLAHYFEESRVGITIAAQALPVMYDAVVGASGLTAAGEVHLQPDWSTFVSLPHVPGQARALADLYFGDEPWSHCPRTFLKRVLARASTRGLRVMAAFENEFYLLRPAGDGWRPADSTVFCQTDALDRSGPVLEAITRALEAQGVFVEMVYSESGPGQFEMPIRYAEGLAAADNQVAVRETVRAVAHQYGLIGSFVPKIFADHAGNGAHLHVSLWRQGQNVIHDVERPAELGPEAAGFIAGILHHLPALMAITTPSTNSFKRIRPHVWSGAFACWGQGNREAAVRVPPPGRSDQPISNFELKTVDPTCNPYLALGALIAAGLDGLATGRALDAPVQVDPADLPEAERQRRGIVSLPTSLGEAIGHLERDDVLRDALGGELSRSFLAVRQREWEAMKELPEEDEVRLLIDRF